MRSATFTTTSSTPENAFPHTCRAATMAVAMMHADMTEIPNTTFPASLAAYGRYAPSSFDTLVLHMHIHRSQSCSKLGLALKFANQSHKSSTYLTAALSPMGMLKAKFVVFRLQEQEQERVLKVSDSDTQCRNPHAQIQIRQANAPDCVAVYNSAPHLIDRRDSCSCGFGSRPAASTRSSTVQYSKLPRIRGNQKRRDERRAPDGHGLRQPEGAYQSMQVDGMQMRR